jgi:uncharacterized damage-inducible protein DinB
MKTTEILAGLITRELRALRREIEAYPDDASLWARPPGIANSGGALAHHLTGNLRHFIGARLGAGSYVRDRAAEFEQAELGREALVQRVDAALDEVERTLAALDPALLGTEFPDSVAGNSVGTAALLTHLLSHLGYHLGQIDYHRRIVTGSGDTVDALAVAEIPGIQPRS